MEDEVRLVKRQLAIMAKARDVALQEKEDWKSTCNRCDSNQLTLAASGMPGTTWRLTMSLAKSTGNWSCLECMLTCMHCPEMHVQHCFERACPSCRQALERMHP